jgi:cell division protein FtsL
VQNCAQQNLQGNQMATRKKIPLVKNRLVILPKSNSRDGTFTRWIVLVFVTMLVFAWLRVQTSQTLSEIKTLEDELRKHENENRHLETEVKKLSNYNRIIDIALNRLDMLIMPNEKIIKVREKE